MEQNEIEKRDEIVVETIMLRWDYSALRAYYMYKINPGRIRNLVILLVVCGCLVALGMAKVDFLPTIIYQIGLVGLFILTYTFIKIDSNARKLEKPGKSIGNRLQTIVLSDKCFRVEWENYNVPLEYRWENVIRKAETENHFFLFVEKLAAVIIPKRKVNEEKLEAIRKLIEESVKQEAKC